MAAGPSVVRYAKRRRVGERLGGRKKIIRGLGGAVFRQAGLRAATEIGGSAEEMIEGTCPARAPRLKWLHQRPAGGARGSHLPDQLLGVAHFPAIPHLRSRNVGEPFIA